MKYEAPKLVKFSDVAFGSVTNGSCTANGQDFVVNDACATGCLHPGRACTAGCINENSCACGPSGDPS
jgi:hypothetical protein